MFTASCPAAASHSTRIGGCPASRGSSSRCGSCRACSGVSVVGEDLAHSSEAVVRAANVRIRLHIPIDGIAGTGPARESLAWRYVGMLIMAQEDVAGLIDVSCPV